MSHNKPDWLGDDGEFKEPIIVVNTQSVARNLKKPNYDEANETALKLAIFLIVGFFGMLMLCGIITSARYAKNSDGCNMTQAEFNNAILYARSPEERIKINQYYYTHCHSD